MHKITDEQHFSNLLVPENKYKYTDKISFARSVALNLHYISWYWTDYGKYLAAESL